MHIAPMPGSNLFVLDHGEISMLLEGKFHSRKCMTCDGTGWIQEQNGAQIGTGFLKDWEAKNPEEWITPMRCDECHMFGQIITFNE